MKYLKTYEWIKSYDGDLYKNINRGEYLDNTRYKEPFDKLEIDSITNLLDSHHEKYSIQYKSVNFGEIDIRIGISEYEYINVIKSRDEWFYLYINWYYYKCDQIDGVLALLDQFILCDDDEDINESKYYYTEDDTFDHSSTAISMSRYDIYKISDLFNNIDMLSTYRKKGNFDTTKGLIKIGYIRIEEKGLIIDVYSYTDEWYKVHVDNLNSDFNDEKIYWCDQMDGLLKLLKNLKNLKIPN